MPVQDYTKWKLPQGAKARLGKGYINDITYSPDSSRLAVASSIGIWIYDAETGGELNLFRGHSAPVERLAYSPDGRFIASSSDDKTVRLRDTVTGEQKAILNHDNNVTDFLYSPDGSTIITNSQGKVFLWDVGTGEQKASITGGSFVCSPDGKTIVINSYKEVGLWDAFTGKRKTTLTHVGGVRDIVYSPDGKTIAINNYKEVEVPFIPPFQGAREEIITINSYKEVGLWDAFTGECKTTLTHVGDVRDIVYSPDSKTITTEGQQEIYLWDVITGKLKVMLTGESVAYSPDGCTIAIKEQREIGLWDTATGKHKTTLATDTYIDYDEISFTEYSPDGSTIASCVFNVHSDAGRMYLWETATGERKISEYISQGTFEYSPDGKTIVSITEFCEFDYSVDGVVAVVGTTTENGDIYLWDTATGKQKVLLYNKYKTPFRGDSIKFRYSPDGRTIVVTSSEGGALWDTATGEQKFTITGHTYSVFGVAYSPDGKTIATRNGPGEDLQNAVSGISVWDTGTAERKVTIAEHLCYIFMYSPDNSTIITCGMHGEERTQHVLTNGGGKEYRLGDGRVIRLWDANTGEHKATLEEHAYDVQSFAISPDGSTIITEGLQHIEDADHFGRFIRLWDATTGEYKTTLVDDKNSGGGPVSFAYSPDGSTIAVGGNWGIGLWNAVTGEHKTVLLEKAALVDHDYIVGVEYLAYSPDGNIIATWRNYRHEVHLWDSTTGTHKTTLRHINSGLGCYIEGFAYSPDGKTIATKSPKKVYLWNAATGERKATFIHKPIGFNLAYSRDGSTIATWNDKEVKLWDTITGEHKITITRHIDDISCLAYSPDGKTIATGSKDGTVLMWEIPFHQHSDINPQEIHGNWRAGWALDVHTVSSRPLPSGRYDTERTKFGELVFQLKYRDDRTKIQPVAEIAAKFVEEKFAVDGHLVLPYLAAIIPIPPSDTNRTFQPVTEVAQEIGKLLSVPVRTDYLMKTKQTIPLKNLSDVESKQEQLRGAFAVQSQDLKNRCVLLVDDLYDSGTTLTEATRVLYEQGSVQHVLVLTLTRTRTGRD